jgi:hypothetical protein
VIDGIRTRDPRDHNPVLYQLSYDHHAPHVALCAGRTSIASAAGALSTGFRRVGMAYNSAAIALAVSTSGPGSGTKIVRR